MSARLRGTLTGATLFLAAGGLAAQERPEGLPPEAALELQIPEDPRLSPDGSRLAYVRRFVGRDGAEYTSIFVEPTAGGAVERLTDGPRVDRTPRFSPDGGRVAWIAYSDGFWEIRVRDLSTRRQRELVPGSRPPGTIAWSPSGDRIAYTRVLPDPEEETGPVHIFVVPASGGRPDRVSTDRLARGGLSLDSRIGWTAGGGSIVVAAAPQGDRDIYEVELTTGLDRRIARRDGPDIDPAVSPAGDFVAFTGPPAGADDGPHALFIADRAGSGPPRAVSRDPGGSVRHPVWAADGGGIYALVETPERRRLVYMRLDGTTRVVGDAVDGPSFDVSASPTTERFAYVSSRPDRAPEVYVGTRASSFPGAAVTTLNYGLDGDRFGRATVVGGRGADGGTAGLVPVVLPPGVENLADVAAGTVVVDARETAGRPGSFDIVRQVLAGAGAAVLIPADLAAAGETVRDLVEAGHADPDRVILLASRSEAIGPAGIETLAVEPPYATGLDWGTIPWRALEPEERVEKLRATLAWLLERSERPVDAGGGHDLGETASAGAPPVRPQALGAAARLPGGHAVGSVDRLVLRRRLQVKPRVPHARRLERPRRERRGLTKA